MDNRAKEKMWQQQRENVEISEYGRLENRPLQSSYSTHSND